MHTLTENIYTPLALEFFLSSEKANLCNGVDGLKCVGV